MEDYMVHKINDKLVVSLKDLPGFRKLGECIIRGNGGVWEGKVDIYGTGDFFISSLHNADCASVSRKIMRLAQNYAKRNGIGNYAGNMRYSKDIQRRLDIAFSERKTMERELT